MSKLHLGVDTWAVLQARETDQRLFHTIIVMRQSRVTLQVTLIPSSQMAYTYPYARGHLLYRRSRVELLKPDYEVHWCLPYIVLGDGRHRGSH